jgi:hypothetical protein
VTFEITALDLTDPDVLGSLGLSLGDLTAADRRTCQEIAELAVAAGFEAVLGPAAVRQGETTLAVFGSAIDGKALEADDLGIRRVPEGPRPARSSAQET